MTDGLERTLEALLFLSADPVSGEALAEASGAELHEVMTALERLREYYEFERRGFVVRELAESLRDRLLKAGDARAGTTPDGAATAG